METYDQLGYTSKTVYVGNLPLGGGYPVRIQSMTNTDTLHTKETVEQVCRLADIGCELVRIAAPGIKEARNLENIKNELVQKNYKLPIIADIHYLPEAALIAADFVEKVRINPGNYCDKNIGKTIFSEQDILEAQHRIQERLHPLLCKCKSLKRAIRIGVNHGSLSERMLSRYGNTAEGMMASALEFIDICEAEKFSDLIISLKSSHIKTMIRSVRLLTQNLRGRNSYPLHLGVTEAGNEEEGRIISAVGIGSLLSDGIGDTIRVSLTENPENEIPVAKQILQASGRRVFSAQFIACPSCGRTKYDIQATLNEVKKRMHHLKGLKIAVMGCVVNGPGEMADADYGYVGAGNSLVHLYKAGKAVQKNVDEKKAVDALIDLIKSNGDWQ